MPSILLVDDSGLFRGIAEKIERRTRCQLLAAISGGEALAVVRRDRPDLIFLDAEMKGMTGFDVCRVLKADSHFSRTPIVLLSDRPDAAEESLHSSDHTWIEGDRVWDDWKIGFPLPANALSVTVSATGAATEVMSFQVWNGERVLVDGTSPETSLNRVLRGRGMAVGGIPSSSAALPLGGDLRVELQRLPAPPFESRSPSGRVWLKVAMNGPAVPAIQELPITVVLATAPPPGLDQAMAELRRIWRAAGIEVLPTMQVQASGPPVVTVDPQLGSDSPMVGEALLLSKGAAPGSLALVVVGDLALPGSDLGLWALSGSIPVPPILGTTRSGVLVSAAFLQRDATLSGQILAHEVGHALGLFHTTERPLIDGQPIHDQLDDTPACPAGADRDQDGFLDGGECAQHDAGNLMFWGTVRGATTLTPGQAEMARRSALVR